MTVQFRKAVLSNGITLVAERHPHVRSVSVGVWIKVGSCQESPAVNGISHFIEHMAFKGTQNRSALDLATVLEALGGDLNAFTEKEATSFHATVLSEHIDIALDVLSDLVIRPSFPRSELERERKVLLQELAMGVQSPEECIYDKLFKEIWKGQSIGQPIIGNKKTIQSISRQTLEAFFHDYYQPRNMVIGVAGNIDFELLKDRCEHYFKTDKTQTPLPLEVAPVKHHSRHLIEKMQTEQLHCLITFNAFGVRDSRRYEGLLLSLILGGGMGSRLFQQVREKAGLAYTVDCDFVPFMETGVMAIYAGMGHGSLSKYLKIVGTELRSLCEQVLTEEELGRIIGQLKGSILLSAEQMENRQESIARNEIIFGKYLSPEETIQEIEAINAERIKEVASELFVPERESVIVLCKRKPVLRKLTVFS